MTSALSFTTTWRCSLVVGALLLAACSSNGKDNSSGGTAGSGSMSQAGATGSSACTETSDPGELVSIPAGEFMMGCNDAVDKQCSDDEKPLHNVTLSAFSIERTEVTQAAYNACVLDGGCEPPSCDWSCDHPDFAASCVTWSQANAYCAWAGRRLPTEAEWEKAARGDKGNKYPWGNDEPTCDLANLAGCGNGMKAVGSEAGGASPYGVLDMAGNMVELVADWYDEAYYAASPAADPKGPSNGKRYVGRGGGFKSDAQYLRASKRDWYDPTDAGASLGFRCAQ